MNVIVKSGVLKNTNLYTVHTKGNEIKVKEYNVDALNALTYEYHKGNHTESLKNELKRMLYEYALFTLTTAKWKNKAKTSKKYDQTLVDSFVNGFDLFALMERYYSVDSKCKPSSYFYRLVHTRFLNYLRDHREGDKDIKENWNTFVEKGGEYVSENQVRLQEAGSMSLDHLGDSGIEMEDDGSSGIQSGVERDAIFEYYDLLISTINNSDLDEETKSNYILLLEKRDDMMFLRKTFNNTSNKGVRILQRKAYQFAADKIGTFDDHLERLIP